MSIITQPMLAATQKVDKLKDLVFPVWATKKLDGIRCLFLDKEVKSRKMKKIPNAYITKELNNSLANCLKNSEIFVGEFDGERSKREQTKSRT